ncbi:hypothetical protein AAY473_011472 [Plecturocebus cupreus]
MVNLEEDCIGPPMPRPEAICQVPRPCCSEPRVLPGAWVSCMELMLNLEEDLCEAQWTQASVHQPGAQSLLR